jgi:hypothetical protein
MHNLSPQHSKQQELDEKDRGVKNNSNSLVKLTPTSLSQTECISEGLDFVTADVLLPLLVFLITRSSLINPFFIINIIQTFLSPEGCSSSFFYQYPDRPDERARLSLPFIKGEIGYYMTTFESAVTFLKGTTPEKLARSIENEEVEKMISKGKGCRGREKRKEETPENVGFRAKEEFYETILPFYYACFPEEQDRIEKMIMNEKKKWQQKENARNCFSFVSAYAVTVNPSPLAPSQQQRPSDLTPIPKLNSSVPLAVGSFFGDGSDCEGYDNGNVFNINLAVSEPLQGMKMEEKKEIPLVKLKEEKGGREEDVEKYGITGKVEKNNDLRDSDVYNNNVDENNNVDKNNNNIDENNNDVNENKCLLFMAEPPDVLISSIKYSSLFMDPNIMDGRKKEDSMDPLTFNSPRNHSSYECERRVNGENEENSGKGEEKG